MTQITSPVKGPANRAFTGSDLEDGEARDMDSSCCRPPNDDNGDENPKNSLEQPLLLTTSTVPPPITTTNTPQLTAKPQNRTILEKLNPRTTKRGNTMREYTHYSKLNTVPIPRKEMEEEAKEIRKVEFIQRREKLLKHDRAYFATKSQN